MFTQGFVHHTLPKTNEQRLRRQTQRKRSVFQSCTFVATAAVMLSMPTTSTTTLAFQTTSVPLPTTTEPTFGTRLHMVATSSTQRKQQRQVDALEKEDIKQDAITSGLISQLAVVALKKRLAAQSGVKVDVTVTSPTDLLLGGRVGPVTVRGRSWQSPLQLTCRAIEATVKSCELDMSAIVTRRKLVLNKPALGEAMIALDATDFGNFITHPLLRPPSALGSSSEVIQFSKHDVSISPNGGVTFYGQYGGRRWELTLERNKIANENSAVITVQPVGPPPPDSEDHQVAMELSASLTEFFNTMIFELDGTFLTFRDMMVTAKGTKPALMLALDIKVHKFPSLKSAF